MSDCVRAGRTSVVQREESFHGDEDDSREEQVEQEPIETQIGTASGGPHGR